MLKRHFEEVRTAGALPCQYPFCMLIDALGWVQLLTQVPSTVSDATRASGGGGLAAKVTTIRIADISFATNNATQIIMLKVNCCGVSVQFVIPTHFCSNVAA